MDDRAALTVFATLSQETRLKILRYLVACGPAGATAGAIATHTGATPSRASFHLKTMVEAGVLSVERSSREMRYSTQFDTISALITYLMEDCCAGSPELRTCCAPAKLG